MGKLLEYRKYVWPIIGVCIAEGNQLSGMTIPWLSEVLFGAAGLLTLFYAGSHFWEQYHPATAPIEDPSPPPPKEPPVVSIPPVQPDPVETQDVQAPTAASKALPPQKRGRIFVGSQITPSYFERLYTEHTQIQADKLMEAYYGKWIMVSCEVLNVGTDILRQGGGYTVLVDAGTDAERQKHERHYVHLRFASKHRRAVEVLTRGDKITVVGTIQAANGMEVTLDKCELQHV